MQPKEMDGGGVFYGKRSFIEGMQGTKSFAGVWGGAPEVYCFSKAGLNVCWEPAGCIESAYGQAIHPALLHISNSAARSTPCLVFFFFLQRRQQLPCFQAEHVSQLLYGHQSDPLGLPCFQPPVRLAPQSGQVSAFHLGEPIANTQCANFGRK